MSNDIQSSEQARREWVEPEVSELKVSDTEVLPNLGRDGGNYIDCVQS